MQGITRGNYVLAFHLEQIGGSCLTYVCAIRNLPLLPLWGYVPLHTSSPHLKVVMNAWKHAFFSYSRAQEEPYCAYVPSLNRDFGGPQTPFLFWVMEQVHKMPPWKGQEWFLRELVWLWGTWSGNLCKWTPEMIKIIIIVTTDLLLSVLAVAVTLYSLSHAWGLHWVRKWWSAPL